ncbi:MAG TPA: hypothetical protein VKU01_14365 [Bryobacteraceae bacterium]|nr:hypothetical protein [Bryobacteraceae bacterium]
MAFAADHHMLNGTWKLVSAQGGPAIQGGTVTIYDREHNIYIARNFILTGGNETVNYSFSTDGQENSSIHEGKTTKTKAKWEGRELVVSVKQDTVTSTERFRLNPDGTLTLTVERPGTETTTLVFERRE